MTYNEDILDLLLEKNLLPYPIGQITPSQCAFNFGADCMIFAYKGAKNKAGNWKVIVCAGMINTKGHEVANHPIEWKGRHDPLIEELETNLDALSLTESSFSFRVREKPLKWDQTQSVYAFVHFLMNRESPISFSLETPIYAAVELIDEFLKKYEFPKLKQGWEEHL